MASSASEGPVSSWAAILQKWTICFKIQGKYPRKHSNSCKVVKSFGPHILRFLSYKITYICLFVMSISFTQCITIQFYDYVIKHFILSLHAKHNRKMIEAQWITIYRLKAICMPKITVNEEDIWHCTHTNSPKCMPFLLGINSCNYSSL